jgi:quercetin dioxygenase-like cupin family protein
MTQIDMSKYANFYDRWLKMWDESQEEKKTARAVIHDEELEWVETDQDYRIALMAGPENGFRTWGTEITIADIPAGHHTGQHEHGEEGIYIVEGEGCSVVNGVRYDWKEGSVLWMPFGSQHQHFNTGDGNARYLSFTALNLEHFAGLGRVDQWQTKGFTDTDIDAEASSDGLDKLGRRIAVFKDSSPILESDPEDRSRGDRQTYLDTPIEGGQGQNANYGFGSAIPEENQQRPPQAQGMGHRDWSRGYMRRYNRSGEDQHWKNMEIEISNSMGDNPGRHGGKHAHMEAYLYIIEGSGYTVVDGVKIPWKKGSLLHVQGPQTQHQHVNDTDKPNAQLRLAPGLRFGFFQPIARERFPYLVWGGRGEGDVEEQRGGGYRGNFGTSS